MKHRYIFIPGAAKSGTTSLANDMAHHEAVCVSSEKEPDYFARFFDKGEAWYETQFEDKSAPVRLDASTSYMAGFGGSCKAYLMRIKEFAPDAKFIFVVREPISRTWSSYWHAIRGGYEPLSFEDAIALNESPHIEPSLYYSRLVEFLEVFDAEQMLIVNFDEYKLQREKVLQRIAAFAELEGEFVIPEQKTANESFQWSGVGKVVRFIPMPVLKKATSLVKSLVPQSLFQLIKKAMSKPTPKISQTQVELVKSRVLDDVIKFEQKTGISLRTGTHWQ